MSNAPTHSVHSDNHSRIAAPSPLFTLGCMTPDAALAVDGYESLGFRTISNECGPFGVGKYEAQDSSTAYCMNQDRFGPSTPGGPWLTYNQGWVWLEDEFAAIICHGYPTATSFGGHNLSPDRARAATQLAVWMLNGTTHTDGSFSYTTAQGVTKSGNFSGDNEVVAAARWLHDSAKSGSIKPHRIAHGAIWELCRAAASVKTCSTCSRPSPHPSKNSQPTPPSRAKTIPTGSTERGSTSMRAPATSVSAASRWTAAVAHRRHFCPIRHIIWSKPKLQRVISPGVTASPFPPAMTAGMSSSMSSPVPLPCASQRSMPRQGQVLKSARHLPALSSPASHTSTPGWSHTLTTDEDGRQHLPTSPWAPLPSMSQELPRAICPPMKPGATPSVPISSETRASLSSSAASPTSPSLLTSKFQSSRTAVIVTNLV